MSRLISIPPLLGALWVAIGIAFAPYAAAQNPASPATQAAQQNALSQLDYTNREDFELATRGLIAREEPLKIFGAQGQPIWDSTQFDFLSGERPDTVHPSLWRQAQLNAIHGLFKLQDRIYQIRGYDLSSMTIIEGDTGWIIVDPLTGIEAAKAAMALVTKTLGEKPIRAVLYTHSHGDHFGGVRALINEDDVAQGKVQIIAPNGFLEEAVSENIIAGNAMLRRVGPMFGMLLPKSATGHVDSGLGKGLAPGQMSLLPPTDVIKQTGEIREIDGVTFEFQLTPNAEAPAEFIFYLPQFRALCVSEEVNGVMHNLYTLRGAKTRDALIWVRHLNDTLSLFGDRTDLVFGSHHWPRWGDDGLEYIAKQRDMYRYLHDQTVRLMNKGYTPLEIADMITLPNSLGQEFYNRDYYGTVSHNVRAVYNFYLGYFDGVPANLNPLPPTQAGARYVDLAGGADALMAKAQIAYDAGEYRWAAELVNHLVFADANHQAARELLAQCYEQMGYQSESGPWRDVYLTGALELRSSEPVNINRGLNSDMIPAIPTGLFFDFMGVRFDPTDAEDLEAEINFTFTDTEETFSLSVRNSVLNNVPNQLFDDPDVSLVLTRDLFNQIIMKKTSFPKEIITGNVSFSGNPLKLYAVFSRLEEFTPNFNIALP